MTDKILCIKNFDTYQHYKERHISSWIKLYYRILDDYKINKLDNEQKWIFIGLLLLAGRTNNQTPLDYGYIGEKISHINGRNKIQHIVELLIKKDLICILSKVKSKSLKKMPISPKIKHAYKAIFKFWNTYQSIKQKNISYNLEKKIDLLIEKGYTIKDIMTAINNYSIILKEPEYWFSYKWTLIDFLQRGFEKFKDFEIAKNNYRKDNNKMKDSVSCPAVSGKYNGLGKK